MIRAVLVFSSILLGHLIAGEQSRVRLFLMKIFARYIEVPLLHLSYIACVGRLRFLSRFFPTRLLIVYPIAYPFGHWGDTGKPIPAEKLVSMIERLEGRIAVGPCRCRIGHRACGHPIETDIVIRTGADVWLEAFPGQYREISRDEAIGIVRRCASLGLFQMVFLHCLVGGAMNEYVICNCCTDGCVPYILNRTLGHDIFPLIKGEWRARLDRSLCIGCEECVRVCPFQAREIANGVPSVLDCYGCGLCAAACRGGATAMVESEQ